MLLKTLNTKRYLESWPVLLLSFILVASCESGRGNIGLGAIHFSPDEETALTVYAKADTNTVIYTIHSRLVERRIRLYIKESENNAENFLPMHYGQLQGFTVFRVVEKSDGWLKVVTNEETLDYGWIKDSIGLVEGWQEFLGSVHHINAFDSRVYKSPSSSSEFGYSTEYDCLNLIDILGDWLKVQHNAEKCNDPKVSLTEGRGFIRWKEGEKLLINFRI